MDPLASVDQLQDAMQRTNLGRDAALSALTRASGAIRGHCHWNLSRQTVTGYVPRAARRYTQDLWLPTLYLVSVDAITISGVPLVPLVDYDWDSHGKVKLASYWPSTFRAVSITYTDGFAAESSEMETIRDVCIAAAARLTGNPLARVSEQTGSEGWQVAAAQVEEGSTLTRGERDTLAQWVLQDPE